MKRMLQLLLLICTTSLVAALRCGSKFGTSCPPGQCCSEAGWCGTTADYCQGPQCQVDYSDSCDSLKRPAGDSTINIPRPRIGSVPYGTIINDCTLPGTVALTFDDGPYIYTSQLLDILDSFNVKATFFIVGNNLGKGQMDDPALPWPAILRRIHSSGHQMASHSWSHQDFGLVNSTIRQAEIIYNEMAFRNIFGWFPTYWRAPYLNCQDVPGCQSILNTMGYHIIDINIDTKDYMYDDPTLIQTSKDRFSTAVSTDSVHNAYLELSHDIHYQTVVNLTAFMINTIRQRGYRPVTVGECLGDPASNWYRDASGTNAGASGSSSSSVPISSTTSSISLTPTSSNVPLPSTTLSTSTIAPSPSSSTTSTTPSSTLVISPNQRCGGTTGYTCQGSKSGNCCSFYGYCGATSDYCGTGCQSTFGTCSQGQGIVTTSNGLCGAKYQASCAGYGTKQCCSSAGYCGNTAAYCGTGCQSTFGICN